MLTVPMNDPQSNVALAEGRSALHILYEVLQTAMAAYPEAFPTLDLTSDQAQFRKTYAEFLPRFELARLNSSNPVAIAQTCVDELNSAVVWRQADSETVLAHALQAPTEPLPLKTHIFEGSPGLNSKLEI